MESVKQSIPDGSQVIFHNEGFSYEEWGAEEEEISSEEYYYINGTKATVIQLATYSELGYKNGEYYDIECRDEEGNKIVLHAVSGYHLTLV